MDGNSKHDGDGWTHTIIGRILIDDEEWAEDMIKVFEAEVYSTEIGKAAKTLNWLIDDWVKSNPNLEIAIEKTELTMYDYMRSEADAFKHIRCILVVHHTT